MFIRMFDDLGKCTKFEYRVFKSLHGRFIMAKLSKMCGLYILDGSIIIVHASLASKEFHDKNKLQDLRSRHVSGRRTDKGLNNGSKWFNKFCMKQDIRRHKTNYGVLL